MPAGYRHTEAGTYSVRAANEMGGLSQPSEAVALGGVTLSPAKQYTTYVTTTALDFSSVEGLKAFVAVSTSTTAVSMQEVGAVPAGTPLLLIAEATSLNYMVPTAASATAPAVNLLKAGDGETVIGGSARYDYVLKDGVFKRAAEGTVDKGKAYLHLESLPSGASSLTITLDDNGEATGIASPKSSPEGKDFSTLLLEGTGEAWYTLDGRRLTQKPTTKGVYVVNGQKVIIK